MTRQTLAARYMTISKSADCYNRRLKNKSFHTPAIIYISVNINLAPTSKSLLQFANPMLH
jgi:hypothetical protein